MKHLILISACFLFFNHPTLWGQEGRNSAISWYLEAGANNSFQNTYFPKQTLWTPNCHPTPCDFNNKSQFGGYLSGGISKSVFRDLQFSIGLECVFTNVVSSGDRDSVVAFYYSTGFNYAWLIHRRYITSGLNLDFNYKLNAFKIHLGLGVPIVLYRNFSSIYTTGNDVYSNIVSIARISFPFVLLKAGIGYNISQKWEIKIQYNYFTQKEVFYQGLFSVGLAHTF